MDNRNYQNGHAQERDREGRYSHDNDRDVNRNTKHANPGNFANDHQKAVEAGRKGGQNSHGGRTAPNRNHDDA